MKSAEQAWQEVSGRLENRKRRREALIQKGKSVGSGNTLFLILSIAYAAIDMEIELERSSVDISGLIDFSKVRTDTLHDVVAALKRSGYEVIGNPWAPTDPRFFISWERLDANRYGEEIGKKV